MIKQSIKKSNKDKISLQDLQNNEVEIEKCKKDPVYFYNTYIRKDGQPILSKEEYDVLMREWEDARYFTTIKDRKGNYLHMKPITSDEAYIQARGNSTDNILIIDYTADDTDSKLKTIDNEQQKTEEQKEKES